MNYEIKGEKLYLTVNHFQTQELFFVFLCFLIRNSICIDNLQNTKIQRKIR